mmetsp:Transcript_103440/g.267537  ORF Transcript_103440/g.267537 Transcript_103440/m.267537 type:complete len:187 (+) Transcript_103440:26-586(+)
MLDRQRLLKIEELADEALRTNEDLFELDRQRNGRREGLGALRRGEAKGATQWVAAEGQFLRLPTTLTKEWLTERQEETAAAVEETRSRLKVQTSALLKEHPTATGLNPAVCDLLLKEHGKPRVKEGAGGAAEAAPPKGGLSKAPAAQDDRAAQLRAAAEREEKRKRNALDYSRFDHMADSDSEGDG